MITDLYFYIEYIFFNVVTGNQKSPDKDNKAV